MRRKHSLFAFFLTFLALVAGSCADELNPYNGGTDSSYLSGPGVFILDHGSPGLSDGSLSFFSYDSLKIYNNVFMEANMRQLGDKPYSMSFYGGKAYIVVCNSGTLEIVNRNTMKSEKTVERLDSPAYVSFLSDSKAYITSSSSDSIAILNLLSNSVSGFIDLGNTSGQLISLYSTTYVASADGGNKIYIINSSNDQITDSLEVAYRPESMVIDWNETLWVLCSGSGDEEHLAELIAIDTRSNEVIRRFPFPSASDSPSCLTIDNESRVLYFIDRGIKRMNIDAQTLPLQPVIPELTSDFYSMGINPLNGEIFVTVTGITPLRGKLLRYKNSGALIAEYQVGYFPAAICFKESNDPVIE